jgi:hypothetical protein
MAKTEAELDEEGNDEEGNDEASHVQVGVHAEFIRQWVQANLFEPYLSMEGYRNLLDQWEQQNMTEEERKYYEDTFLLYQ